MCDRLIDARHDLHRENIVQKFRIKIIRSCGCSIDDLRRTRIQPQLYRLFSRCTALVHQTLFQLRQETFCHILRHQTDLHRIAHARSARLGILYDIHRLCQIRRTVHIDMTDAGSGLDARYFCVFHTRADQPRTSARNE